jgi:hypothetical protein
MSVDFWEIKPPPPPDPIGQQPINVRWHFGAKARGSLDELPADEKARRLAAALALRERPAEGSA